MLTAYARVPTLMHDLKRRALSYVFDRSFSWRINEFAKNQQIEVDYPVNPEPRYSLGRQAHPQLWTWFDGQRAACEGTVQAVARNRGRLEQVVDTTHDPRAPHWNQVWFTGLDAMVLYTLVADRRPNRIVEIGSGNSTKFTAQAIADAGLSTSLVSIDPQPRAEIDGLCDQVIR